MRKNFAFAILVAFFLGGCNSVVTSFVSPTPELELRPSETRLPVIHSSPGEGYQVLFSIPAGEGEIVKYHILADSIRGPNALTILPDDTLMIADPVGKRILHYDPDGKLLGTIDLSGLGIYYIKDLVAGQQQLFLLDAKIGASGGNNFTILHLSMDGELITTDEIPGNVIAGDGHLLGNSLQGISVDCDDNLLLEVPGGGWWLYRVKDAQSQHNLMVASIVEGYACNDKLFHIIGGKPGVFPQVIAGDAAYKAPLSKGSGGLQLLTALPGGDFYVIRDDVVSDWEIRVDETVHFVSAEGQVEGVARVPLDEFYYVIKSRMVVDSKGEVIVLLSRPDRLDIIRLNFYQQLEPLVKGAVIPQLIPITNSP